MHCDATEPVLSCKMYSSLVIYSYRNPISYGIAAVSALLSDRIIYIVSKYPTKNTQLAHNVRPCVFDDAMENKTSVTCTPHLYLQYLLSEYTNSGTLCSHYTKNTPTMSRVENFM